MHVNQKLLLMQAISARKAFTFSSQVAEFLLTCEWRFKFKEKALTRQSINRSNLSCLGLSIPSNYWSSLILHTVTALRCKDHLHTCLDLLGLVIENSLHGVLDIKALLQKLH